jgi:hypothetical protein
MTTAKPVTLETVLRALMTQEKGTNRYALRVGRGTLPSATLSSRKGQRHPSPRRAGAEARGGAGRL